MSMELRLELFPADLNVFADFYARVLSFAVVDDRRDSGYVAIQRDHVRIAAVRVPQTVQPSMRAVPAGTEIVLEVDDVIAERDRVVAAQWPLESDLKLQTWELTDFRLFDPDGYYLRITGKREQ